jgi:hypothetical protein
MALDRLRARLVYLHDVKGIVWRKIAEMPEFNNVSFGVLNGIYHGREPEDDDIRLRLDLPIVEMIAQVRNGKSGQFSKRR